MSDRSVTAAFYVVLKPKHYQYGNGAPYITGINATDLRAKKPRIPAGSLAVKVVLTFDVEQLKESIPVLAADVKNFTVAAPVMEVTT